MSLKNILALFKVNLIYANPQQTAAYRKKGKTGSKLFKSLLNQYLLLSLVFVVAYSWMFLTINLSEYPGFFTMYLALFALMAFAQSVSVIFNVFYQSEDLEDYLYLPFKQGEVFFAKLAIVALTILPFALPLFGVLLVTTLGKFSLPLGILLSLVLFLLFFALMFTLYILLVSSLTQTKVFLRHKKTFSSALMFLSSFGMVAGILYINSARSSSETYINDVLVLKDQFIIYPLYPFFKLATDPFSVSSLLIFIGLLVLLGIFTFILIKMIIPRFYLQANVEPVKKKAQGKGKKQSLKKQLLTYNFNLIKDPTLLMQFFTSTIILPLCFVFPVASIGTKMFTHLPLTYAGVTFLAGGFFAFLCLGNTSLSSVIISLDRENFSFIKSLPLSLKKYLSLKFWFTTLFQLALMSLSLLGLGLFLKLPLLLIFTLLLGTILTTIIVSLFYFARDYRLLTLNWTNITQLFQRGGGNFTRMLILFGTMLVGTLFVGLFAFLSTLSPLVGNLLIFLFALGLFIIFYYHYQKNFWEKLD